MGWRGSVPSLWSHGPTRVPTPGVRQHAAHAGPHPPRVSGSTVAASQPETPLLLAADGVSTAERRGPTAGGAQPVGEGESECLVGSKNYTVPSVCLVHMSPGKPSRFRDPAGVACGHSQTGGRDGGAPHVPGGDGAGGRPVCDTAEIIFGINDMNPFLGTSRPFLRK